MSQGNERFIQYLATSNHSFELNDFLDRTTPLGYNMSDFVRRYAKYINDKTISYRTLALDVCKIRSGNDNALRTMNMDNLSKTLPIVRQQFDSLLDFGAEPKDLNNGIIMAAFRLLYKDLVRLYVAYQEAIINLLERYFKLSRRKTREALEMYKDYLARMDRVAGFLRVVESVGLDKSEMPDLTNSPASILKVLEEHLAGLEAKKRGTGAATPASPEHEQVAEDVPSNKENEPTAEVATPSKPLQSPGDSSGGSVNREPQEKPPASPNGEPSTDGNKPAVSVPKKPPPVRPSPLVSPKVSPSGSKHALGGGAGGGTAVISEKRAAPPERPPKPPSRPPPPSTVAPTTTGQQQQSSSVASSTQSKTKSPKLPTPPPPHPPPPSAHSSHSASSQQQHQGQMKESGTTEPEQDSKEQEATASETKQQKSQTSEVQDARGTEKEATVAGSPSPPPSPPEASGDATLPSCSTITENAGVSTEAYEQQANVETNHLANNINNNGGSYENGSNANDNGEPEVPAPPPAQEGDDETGNDRDSGVQAVDDPPSPPPPLDEASELQLNGGEQEQQQQNNTSSNNGTTE